MFKILQNIIENEIMTKILKRLAFKKNHESEKKIMNQKNHVFWENVHKCFWILEKSKKFIPS